MIGWDALKPSFFFVYKLSSGNLEIGKALHIADTCRVRTNRGEEESIALNHAFHKPGERYSPHLGGVY